MITKYNGLALEFDCLPFGFNVHAVCKCVRLNDKHNKCHNTAIILRKVNEREEKLIPNNLYCYL